MPFSQQPSSGSKLLLSYLSQSNNSFHPFVSIWSQECCVCCIGAVCVSFYLLALNHIFCFNVHCLSLEIFLELFTVSFIYITRQYGNFTAHLSPRLWANEKNIILILIVGESLFAFPFCENGPFFPQFCSLRCCFEVFGEGLVRRILMFKKSNLFLYS